MTKAKERNSERENETHSRERGHTKRERDVENLRNRVGATITTSTVLGAYHTHMIFGGAKGIYPKKCEKVRLDSDKSRKREGEGTQATSTTSCVLHASTPPTSQGVGEVK